MKVYRISGTDSESRENKTFVVRVDVLTKHKDYNVHNMMAKEDRCNKNSENIEVKVKKSVKSV